MEIWLGIAYSNFRQFLMELSAQDTSIFLLPDANLSKCQWIFTKLDICIDIVDIWFGIAFIKNSLARLGTKL